MGEEGKSQEKTEQPTPKRLRDARKKGQVYKSKDLEMVMVLISAFAVLALTFPFITREIRDLMEMVISQIGTKDLDLGIMYELVSASVITLTRVCTPFLVTVFLTAAVVGFLQVGPIFSTDPLKFQPKRLNMVENIKNLLKPKIFFELAKNIFKVVVIFMIAYYAVKDYVEPFLLSVSSPIQGSTALGGMILVKFLMRFFVFFIFLAIIDLIIQRKEYIKNLKMTKEEVKREYKEDEGDPLIKSQRKQLHMEMAMGDVRQQVKSADVVVTNPTHLAVVLKYDHSEMVAPQIVAKGQRLFAQYIKELAEEYEIPVVRNIPLAWSLIEMELGDDIPEDLYLAVAEVLTFVYRLKRDNKS